MTDALCPCWVTVCLHQGHCCFKHYDQEQNVVTCGHDEAGMTVVDGLAKR